MERLELRLPGRPIVGALPFEETGREVLDPFQEEAAEVGPVGVDEINVPVAAAPRRDQMLETSPGRGRSAPAPGRSRRGRPRGEARAGGRSSAARRCTTSSGPEAARHVVHEAHRALPVDVTRDGDGVGRTKRPGTALRTRAARARERRSPRPGATRTERRQDENGRGASRGRSAGERRSSRRRRGSCRSRSPRR